MREREGQRRLYCLVSDCGVVGYCVSYLRKCKDGEENKRNSILKKISFFIFVLSINLFFFLHGFCFKLKCLGGFLNI